MYDEDLAKRLLHLRMLKGVSAREMSLSIGQNESYINNIEMGRFLPSMSVFFFICEYLGITPSEFFDESQDNPKLLHQIIDGVKKLKEEDALLTLNVVNRLLEGKSY